MTRVVFAIPGDLATRTGGYAYARELIRHLPDCGIAIRHCPLPSSFPHPSDADVSEAMHALRRTAKNDVLLIDGLAFGALPADHIAALDRAIVALVHHPLGFESGLSEAKKEALIASERAALASADHVVVSSETTRDVLVADFHVTATRMTIAEPGTYPVVAKRADPPSGAGVRLLAIGSIVPRKGFDLLIAALAGLRDLDWRLRLVGSLDRSPTTAQALRAQILASEFADRVTLVGELGTELLETEYSAADLFILSSHYEGYGMVLAEAMANGLPVVTTTGGAAARTVPDAAALKVPPGDAAALTEALRHAVTDAALRRRLAIASAQAGRALPRWPGTAAKVATVLHAVARRTQS